MATTTPTEWKTPFKANTTDFDGAEIANQQSESQVVALTGGRFLVVWLDYTDPLSLGAPDIFGQMFDALGNRLGDELFLLNAYVDYAQGPPKVAALSDGGFLLTYQTSADPFAGEGENIIAERYDADGGTVGQSARVAVTVADETAPAIVSFSDNSYVVVYVDNDSFVNQVYGVVVDAAGIIGEEFSISAFAEATGPQAALLADGNFVVVYSKATGGGEVAFSVRSATGAEVVSGSVATAAVVGASPDVAALSGGGFVVVWRDADGEGAGMPGIMARRFDAAGVAEAAAVPVNATTAGDQSSPSVTALADGGYAIVWDDDGADVLRALRFDANGEAVGSEFVVASLGAEYEPSFALLGDGRIVVSFTSETGGNADVFAGIWDPRTSPVVGTSAADVLTGRLEGGTIWGEAGADTLYGSSNADILIGGSGADQLIGGAGTDTADYATSAAGVTISLQTGNAVGGDAAGDTFSSVENLTGSALADYLKGNLGANRLDGGDGDDMLEGGAGADTLIGGAGSDTARYVASSAGVTISLLTGNAVGGDAGGDSLSGVENLIGSNFADFLKGNAAANVLAGGVGADRLEGYNGDDTLAGGAGADVLNGDAGSDTADYSTSSAGVTISLVTGNAAGGDAAGDTFSSIENLIGSNFADFLKGDAAANVLTGGVGADRLDGYSGDDTLAGGAGADTLNGDAGSDTANYSTSSAGVTISLATGNAVGGDAAGDTFSSIENLTGSAFADYLKGDAAANRLDGGSSADRLEGGSGDDSLEGGAGVDALVGGAGTDTADYAKSSAGVTISLTTGNTLGGDAAGDTFFGIESLTGSAFADYLKGDAGANRLIGNAGADRLEGMAGDDVLTGGAGSDRFIFANGVGDDRITDFAAGAGSQDLIDLSRNSLLNSFADVLSHASQSGADTLIDLGGGDLLTLAGVTRTALHQDDFVF